MPSIQPIEQELEDNGNNLEDVENKLEDVFQKSDPQTELSKALSRNKKPKRKNPRV